MHKISLVISGILFLLGCLTLGAAIFFSEILPRIFYIYLTTNIKSSGVFDLTSMSSVNLTDFYVLAVAELIFGALGYFFSYLLNRKNVE